MTSRFVLLILLCCVLHASNVSSSESDDEALIVEASRDYIEGWFSGNEKRMEQAVSPYLRKAIVAAELGISEIDLIEATALSLVQSTGRQPVRRAEPQIEILDRFENVASVRIDAGEWIDYLHLGKVRGEWKIINVLWEKKSGG